MNNTNEIKENSTTIIIHGANTPTSQMLPAPAGLTTPTREVQAERRNNRDGQGETPHTSHQLPAPARQTNPSRVIQSDKDNRDGQNETPQASFRFPVPAKHNDPTREVQAERRNNRDGQPENAQETLPSGKRERTATGYAQQDGRKDTSQTRSFWAGGSEGSASSPKWKMSENRYFDPLLGYHEIPVVQGLDLLERIAEDGNIIQAIDFINRDWKKTPGYDHKSVETVCGKLLSDQMAREEIRQRILQGKYHPDKVLLEEIPKPNGDKRTLGLATVQDRIIMRAIFQVVKDNLPANPWSPYSYAYQVGRNIGDAIGEVNRIRQEGYKFAITLDLKSFFDNVPHDRLIRKIRAHIRDERVVRLVIAFLTPLVIGLDGNVTKNRKGTIQGSPTSPWLASMLYLDELDQVMSGRDLRYVRFADDITVFSATKKSAKRSKKNLIKYIENTMGCPVNKEKTEIVEIEHLALLGVTLDDGWWRIQQDKEYDACAKYQKNIEEYTKTKNDYYLRKAVQQMRGFINGYTKIPNISHRQIRALKRWCLNKWWKTGERKVLFDQKWLVTD